MHESSQTVDVDFVAIRYLAGGGDPAWITVPLHRACGWSHGHDPLMPRVILSSPDQKTLLRLEPDPEGQWWTIHHTAGPDRPAWYASFGARTPVEIIAAFTDALTDPAGHPSTARTPFELLDAAGWSPPDHSAGMYRSPDATTFVETDSGAWLATTMLGRKRPVWQARFSEGTPLHLITAFTAALADPAPLLRATSPSGLPTLNPVLISRARQKVPAVEVASALEDRVRALAARHKAPAAAPPALPRRPSADPGHTR
ncbi:DUF317 domain-containing protein [Streptomyces achromogenes]|uniref:DUF317 domain-containing protein n=1 Tax=Streptomyces achromogenes TaxID=67255 RepID=UPI0037D8B825